MSDTNVVYFGLAADVQEVNESDQVLIIVKIIYYCPKQMLLESFYSSISRITLMYER